MDVEWRHTYTFLKRGKGGRLSAAEVVRARGTYPLDIVRREVVTGGGGKA